MDFIENIAAYLSARTGLAKEEIKQIVEVPPNPSMGDYAFPCFRLSKPLRKAPNAIACALEEDTQKPQGIAKMCAQGPYLNFFVDRALFIENILTRVRAQKDRFGSSDEGKGRAVCIDYSSINIAKPFHVGHLSTTVIGASLARIYDFLGYRSVSINHLGDWGTQFGKLIVAYKRWGDQERIEADSVDELLKIYVRFHEEAEKEPALDDEARAWFKKIEEGDGEALALMQWFRELTLKEAHVIYDLLNIRFDSYAGESFYNDKMQPVLDELEQKGLLCDSDGAKMVDLSAYDMPPCLILKSDGATLYATRDIAAAFYRKKTYDFYKNLYVVAYQQNLHFRQWFKVIELMGYDWASQLEHVAFGMVSMEEGTLSTRKGKVVLLKDVLNQAVEKSFAIMEEKNPELADKQTVAQQVGVGAVVFDVLSNNRIKDIVFSFSRVLNFDGETGPYVQYSHARCCSVLEKGAGICLDQADLRALDDEEAFAVARLLYSFEDAVREACRKNEPSVITRHVVDIAQAFNKYYYEHRILIEGDEQGSAARLMLTDAVRQTIRNGLMLLNIASPAKM
ncbi:MAG: arginine--tRNA ligase [Christensenellales bacterium]